MIYPEPKDMFEPEPKDMFEPEPEDMLEIETYPFHASVASGNMEKARRLILEAKTGSDLKILNNLKKLISDEDGLKAKAEAYIIFLKQSLQQEFMDLFSSIELEIKNREEILRLETTRQEEIARLEAIRQEEIARLEAARQEERARLEEVARLEAVRQEEKALELQRLDDIFCQLVAIDEDSELALKFLEENKERLDHLIDLLTPEGAGFIATNLTEKRQGDFLEIISMEKKDELLAHFIAEGNFEMVISLVYYGADPSKKFNKIDPLLLSKTLSEADSSNRERRAIFKFINLCNNSVQPAIGRDDLKSIEEGNCLNFIIGFHNINEAVLCASNYDHHLINKAIYSILRRNDVCLSLLTPRSVNLSIRNAVKHDNCELTYSLIQCGANTNKIESELSLTDIASRFNNVRVMRLLFAPSERITSEKITSALFIAVENKSNEVLNFLLGLDIAVDDYKTNDGNIIHAAVMAQNHQALAMLLENKKVRTSFLNSKSRALENQNSLQLCCKIGNLVAAQILLHHGASTDGCLEILDRKLLEDPKQQNYREIITLINEFKEGKTIPLPDLLTIHIPEVRTQQRGVAGAGAGGAGAGGAGAGGAGAGGAGAGDAGTGGSGYVPQSSTRETIITETAPRKQDLGLLILFLQDGPEHILPTLNMISSFEPEVNPVKLFTNTLFKKLNDLESVGLLEIRTKIISSLNRFIDPDHPEMDSGKAELKAGIARVLQIIRKQSSTPSTSLTPTASQSPSVNPDGRG